MRAFILGRLLGGKGPDTLLSIAKLCESSGNLHSQESPRFSSRRKRFSGSCLQQVDSFVEDPRLQSMKFEVSRRTPTAHGDGPDSDRQGPGNKVKSLVKLTPRIKARVQHLDRAISLTGQHPLPFRMHFALPFPISQLSKVSDSHVSRTRLPSTC